MTPRVHPIVKAFQEAFPDSEFYVIENSCALPADQNEPSYEELLQMELNDAKGG